MTVTSFTRDPAQQAAALAKANMHRTAQAAFKRRLCALSAVAARDELAAMLAGVDVDPEIAATRAFQLLMACPKVGEMRARRALRVAGVPERKRLRDMTPRQRQALAVAVGRIHEGVV